MTREDKVLISKTLDVICSCKSWDQLNSARNYCVLAANKLSKSLLLSTSEIYRELSPMYEAKLRELENGHV